MCSTLKDDLCSWGKLSNAINLHWQIFTFAYDLSQAGSMSSLSFILIIAATREEMLIYAYLILIYKVHVAFHSLYISK